MKKITSTLMLLSLIVLNNVKAENIYFNHEEKTSSSKQNTQNLFKTIKGAITENKEIILTAGATALATGIYFKQQNNEIHDNKTVNNEEQEVERTEVSANKASNKFVMNVGKRKYKMKFVSSEPWFKRFVTAVNDSKAKAIKTFRKRFSNIPNVNFSIED